MFAQSPNYTKGRGRFKPSAVVIHIMEGTLVGTDSWFASENSQASAHYGMGANGEEHQYVKEEDQAWHTGKVIRPIWPGLLPHVNPNLHTIGIEHEGYVDTVWSDVMKKVSAARIRKICLKWDIPIDAMHIVPHFHIRADKPDFTKANPGLISELIYLALQEDNSLESTTELQKEVFELLNEAVGLIAKASALMNK